MAKLDCGMENSKSGFRFVLQNKINNLNFKKKDTDIYLDLP